MRGPDAPRTRRLAEVLPLAEDDSTPLDGPPSPASAAWAAYLGGEVVVVPSMAIARGWLMDALRVADHANIEVLPMATGELVDQLRSAGKLVHVVDLDGMLRARQKQGTLAWLQALSGLETGLVQRGIIERQDSLPVERALMALPPGCVAVIWSLALSRDPACSGAVIGLAPAVAEEFRRSGVSLPPPVDDALNRGALRQLARWRAMVPLQRSVVERTWAGLREAAGLRVSALVPGGGIDLPGAVPVQIPVEVDPATFFAYVRREGTPVSWLPLEHPLHFRAAQLVGVQAARRISKRMARWLLIPAGPDDSLVDTEQAVLGVVKSAEYLGVRWRAEPVRAAAYANLLEQWYGPDHDAFRPVFPVVKPDSSSEVPW